MNQKIARDIGTLRAGCSVPFGVFPQSLCV